MRLGDWRQRLVSLRGQIGLRLGQAPAVDNGERMGGSWDDRFSELAAAVAGGETIDWATEGAGATTSQVELLEQLRDVERQMTMSVRQPVPAGRRWGPFELIERIGTGSVGSVYRAWDPDLRHDVAVKLLNSERTDGDALMAEARSLAQVRSHPNIVTVYGAAVADGQAGFWMELIDGRTFADLLGDWGPFGAAEAASVGVALNRALAAIHAKGLVHQDVKAQNVMRESGGRVVLMDLGASSVVSGCTPPRWGTPLYMAPELFDRCPATPQSDIYSLGVLLFHLTTGQFPHGDDSRVRGASTGATLGRRRWLADVRPDLPDPFVVAVETALEPDPADRFCTAGAFGRQLWTVGA